MAKVHFEKAGSKPVVEDNAIEESPAVAVESTNPLFRYSLVELPSGGALGYPAEIEYRDILVRDEKEISGATDKTFPKVINNVLKGLLKDQSWFESMATADRDYLLLWIWANNYSLKKNVETDCPECRARNQYEIDITTLKVNDLDPSYQHPTPYTTRSGIDITLRLLTVKDEEIARKFSGNSGNKDMEELFVLLCCSVSFGAAMPLKEKMKKIENEFTGYDMSVIRGFHAQYKFGVESTVGRDCNECGHSFRVSVPFGIDHFLPNLSGHFK